MTYQIAICDNKPERKQTIIEMLHVYENEYQITFIIHSYSNETKFLNILDTIQYNIIFFNIEQGGHPGELDNIFILHKKNPSAALFSICPSQEYRYYHDLAEEASYMSPPLSYLTFRRELYRLLKDINLKKLGGQWEKEYVKIHTKLGEEYIERKRICFIYITRHRTIIHTLDRNYITFMENHTIRDLKKLFSENFFQANRHCLFNLSHLYNMEKVTQTSFPWQNERADYYLITPTFTYIPTTKRLYTKLFPQFINHTLKKTKIKL